MATNNPFDRTISHEQEVERTDSTSPEITDQEKDAVKIRQASDGETTIASAGDGTLEQPDPFNRDQDVNGAPAVNYKTMEWWHAGFLMIAETISLGILSLPHAISLVGFVPGVLLLVVLGIMATYTAYALSQFKAAYPSINSFADAGYLTCGRFGQWMGQILQQLVLVFVMAAHVLTFSVMMNVLTDHATCTTIFMVMGTIVSLILTIPRTLKAQSYISIFSCLSIAIAVLVTMIGVGIEPPGKGTAYIVTPSSQTSLAQGSSAVSEIIIAFTGHIAYFHFLTEMRKPRDFPKALAMQQSVAISFYITVAVVIYYYAGQDVKSPALGSASPTIRKVAFGIAAPTIVIAGVINANVAAKNCYMLLWRKNPAVMAERGLKARGSWWAIISALWLAAWLISEAIPVFSQMLGIIGAGFCTWFSLGFPAGLWMWMTVRGKREAEGRDEVGHRYGVKRALLLGVNGVIVLLSGVMCVLGLYGAGMAIAENDSTQAPFSCADNSG
ncbi:hypothetical protein MBLNU230_g6341t1 [Neophaeotheca triangularis]